MVSRSHAPRHQGFGATDSSGGETTWATRPDYEGNRPDGHVCGLDALLHHGNVTRGVRRAIAVLIAALAALAIPVAASAHAELGYSSPQANAHLGITPGVVVLEFTQTLNTQLSSGSVIDPERARVEGRGRQRRGDPDPARHQHPRRLQRGLGLGEPGRRPPPHRVVHLRRRGRRGADLARDGREPDPGPAALRHRHRRGQMGRGACPAVPDGPGPAEPARAKGAEGRAGSSLDSRPRASRSRRAWSSSGRRRPSGREDTVSRPTCRTSGRGGPGSRWSRVSCSRR